MSSREAICQACLKRFRPITMTMAAMLRAVPRAIGFGEGAELHRLSEVRTRQNLRNVLTRRFTPIFCYTDRIV